MVGRQKKVDDEAEDSESSVRVNGVSMQEARHVGTG